MKPFFTSKIYIFVFFLIFNCPLLFSIEETATTDARALSMGNLHALSHEFSNPASLSLLPGPKITANVYNRFQMSELNTSCLRFVLPNRFLDTGIQLIHFGYQDYNYLSFQTGMARRLNERFSMGTKINLIHLNNFLYEKSQTGIKAGFGCIFQVFSSGKICLLAENIASTLEQKDYSIHIGFDYQCLPNLNLSSEISYNVWKQTNISLGTEYQIIDELYFRAGFQTYFSTPSLGAAYTFKNIDIGIAFTTHQSLGNSTMIEVGYKF